jgi:hypothetical protein
MTDVVNLASSRYFCKNILEKLFLSKGELNVGSFLLPKDISVRYDVRVGSNLRTKYFKYNVRPMYLISVYSYTQNLSEFLTRMINDKSSFAKYQKEQEDYAQSAEVNMYKAYEVVVGGNNCVVRTKGALL